MRPRFAYRSSFAPLARPGFDARADYSGLRDYQRVGVDTLRAHRRFLLADEMRLGKSVQVLRALPPLARTIVVSPSSVMGVWEREAWRWRPDLVTRKRRLFRPRRGEVVIVSWDSLPEPVSARRLVLEDLSDVHLVGDEIHMAMHESAVRTQRWRALQRQSGWTWVLSGTPMPGTPEQFWGVLVSTGLSHVFRDLEEFVSLCGGKRKPQNRGYEWGTISPEVHARIAPVMLRRLSNLVSMPSVVRQDVPTPISIEMKRSLGALKKTWDASGSTEIPGHLLFSGLSALARSRIDAAVEFATRAAESMSVLVFSAHKAPVLAFDGVKGAGFIVGDEQSEESRQATVDRFQRGDLRILAMTIRAGGVGLDLSRADGVLFVDLPFTPGEIDQAEARAFAVGKTSPVAIWTMTSDHPLEMRVRMILEEKRRLRREMGV
jgi:hypothetical protein